MQATETIVSMPIRNPETGRSSRSFRFMGVVDRIEGRKLIDWKGVSDPARFIKQRQIGFQGELYAIAVGHVIEEIEYRLITRPRLQYSHPRYRYAVMRAGRKTAVRIFDELEEAQKLAEAQGCSVVTKATGDVSLGVYEKRCLDWLIEEPKRVVLYSYHLTPSKTDQARWYLWESSKRLLENRRCKRWLPNVGACFAYERQCPYMSLCEAAQNGADWQWVIEDRYRALESSHPELDGKDDGDDVLTHSSLEDLARCEMYYYWRHELRLRRGQESDSEPLWVGSAMHRGLEAFVDGGLTAANQAIDKWANENPVLGEDANWKQDEQAAKARAMVRVAALKWGMQ
jgi:RecB family exonuclease